MPANETPAATAVPPGQRPLRLLHAYSRAADYLPVGQLSLFDNPLLRQPRRLEHAKPRLPGHWGTTPGLNFIHAHLNRVIRAGDLNAICQLQDGAPRQIEYWGTPMLLTPRTSAAEAIPPSAPAVAPLLQSAGRAPRRRQPSPQPAAVHR